MDFPKAMQKLVERGADEFTVRACAPRQHPNGHMVPQWQGLVKFSNRNRAWGVGVADTPQDALATAMTHAISLPHGQAPAKTEAAVPVPVRKRARTITG